MFSLFLYLLLQFNIVDSPNPGQYFKVTSISEDGQTFGGYGLTSKGRTAIIATKDYSKYLIPENSNYESILVDLNSNGEIAVGQAYNDLDKESQIFVYKDNKLNWLTVENKYSSPIQISDEDDSLLGYLENERVIWDLRDLSLR